MEVVLTAAIGELASRSISFLIDRYSRPTSPDMEEKLQSLQRLLLRICVVVEAAEGRRITSQAMLRQLELMRKEMYRGYYTLDTFIRYQSHHGPEEETVRDKGNSNEARRQCFILSKFNPGKRLLLSTSNEAQSTANLQLQQVLHGLSTVLADATEFIVLLNTYQPLHRQPYSTYLFLEMSMFGRQMELEHVFSFLLHADPQPARGNNPSVLPIVGSYGIGKSTLIAHVCNDERVRDHFSRIVFFSQDDFNKDGVTTFMDGGIHKHQQDNNGKDTWLVVVSVPGDIDEVAWRRLYLASATESANKGKIIITSRSHQVVSFGTTQPLLLNSLADEAYWYFFKALAFGSADPREHPKLVAIAMKIAMLMKMAGAKGFFLRANVVTTILRANMNVEFWSKILTYLTDHYTQRINPLLFYEHPYKWWLTKRRIYFSKMFSIKHCVFHNFRASAPDEEIPSVQFIDVLFGRVKCCVGRHEVLVWKGRLPPHKSYILSCDIQKPAG